MSPPSPWTPLTDATRSEPRLLDRVRLAVRARHYSRRTEEAYVGWVRRFVLFHGKRHPVEMGEKEINLFLSDLAVRHKVTASTQNQALAALLFLYRAVLERPAPEIENVVRASRPTRLPTVMTRAEVKRTLSEMEGIPRLVATLLYGTGMRLLECLRSGKGPRLREQPDHGPGCERSEGPDRALPHPRPARRRDLARRSPPFPRQRPGGRRPGCVSTRRARAQIPRSAVRVGLAVGVPRARRSRPIP